MLAFTEQLRAICETSDEFDLWTDEAMSAEMAFPSNNTRYRGFGSKAVSTIKYLKVVASLTPERPTFVVDARDVLVNGTCGAPDVLQIGLPSRSNVAERASWSC